jgi:acyl-coenzyme A synthetase/AMP-(fatty) acid ligase
VPPHHMYGFETTVLLPLHAHTTTWCGAAFYPEDVAAALRAVPEPRMLITTPLQLRAMLHASVQLPVLDRIISATAPLSADMAAAAEKRWGTQVFEIFGATEVGSIASRRTIEGDVWKTYPRVRLSPATPDGEPAEAVASGPLAEPCRLSDAIEILDPCHFRLLGRRADMIKLGGRRASLAELNRILTGIEGVLDGQFVAPEDLDRRPAARLLVFVVAPERTADDILAALRGRIDPPFLPRRVIRVAELPRNEVGKLTDQAVGALRARLSDA